LYADAVDLLLDQWESPKMVRDAAGNPVVQQPSLAEWLNIDRAKMRQLLNRLAYEAHAGQPDLVGTADIPERDLVTGLLHLSPQQDLRPRRLMDYLSERAGLLLSRGEGVYTFPHRTFQEYLAACHLTDDDFPDKLADLARQDPNRWREVALLAGAKAVRGSASFVWVLAEALCPADPVRSDDLSRWGEPTEAGSTNKADAWGAHLAGQFLAETADLSSLKPQHQAKVERVQRWLVHLLGQRLLPATERALAGVSLAQLGDPRRELMEVDRMPLCRVAGGDFWMGSDEMKDEQPPHLNRHLTYDYWLGRYPVTNAQYNVFVAGGGYRQRAYWPEAAAAGIWKDGQVRRYWGGKDHEDAPYDFGKPFNLPNHPVVGISWYEALAFCRWLTARWRAAGWLPAGWAVRLPSEAEWEKGARGGLTVPVKPVVADVSTFLTAEVAAQEPNAAAQRRFPWGNADIDGQANVEAAGISASSTPGCFPMGASPNGCEEMVGNVYEWTRSLWGFDYPYIPDARRENLATGSSTGRVLRGGAFYSNISYSRCPARYRYFPDYHGRGYGVRVAVAPSSSTSDL
jgi:formylglycine-generating enzyme required for sulfatase activity